VARELGFAAITALPLVAAGRVLGVATFYFGEVSEVTRDARALLRLVADLLASTADQASRRDELRRVNAALGELTVELEQQFAAVGSARRARDDFLEGVSYELRSPLAGLLSNLSLLEQEVSGALSAGQRDEVRAVRESATRVLDLVEALLDFAGARRGTLELSLEEFDPRVPMRDAVREVGSPSSGVAVTSVEPVLALPPMRGDRRKIVRLLVTLVEHVLDVASSDRVEIAVDAVNERVRYRVQETGGRRAVTPDADAPVTDDAQPAAPAPPSTQLVWALDLARSVSRVMGGGVSAEAVGEGRTAFILDLPLEGPPPAEPVRG
jgi:signal transduction histidine kinase